MILAQGPATLPVIFMKTHPLVSKAAILFAVCPLLDAAEGISWNQDNKHFKPASAHEGPVEAFLKPGIFESQQVFAKERFPNLVVAMDGTVIAAWNGVQVRRSTDGGSTWGEPILIAKGFMGGGFTVDEISGDILAFIEDGHPPAPLHIHRSKDNGLTWQKQDTLIHPNSFGHVPAMHMNEHGITLRHGPYKGRLIRPTRWYGRSNYPPSFSTPITPTPCSATTAAAPGCLRAIPDHGHRRGLHRRTLRRHPPLQHPPPLGAHQGDALWRWSGHSSDGGKTWQNPQRSRILPDGDPASTYGLMGGLVRLPVLNRDILLFSNIVNPKGRKNGHVWASFDGGKSWPLRRQVFDGNFAYSCMNAGRPGTPSRAGSISFTKAAPRVAAASRASTCLEGEETGDGNAGLAPERLVFRPQAGARLRLQRIRKNLPNRPTVPVDPIPQIHAPAPETRAPAWVSAG
jgi:sialidase-1